MTQAITDNLALYTSAFIECFEITEEVAISLEYQSIDSWDSVGHMSLIALLEEKFNVMMDTDDIIDFSSFGKGKEILRKYDVEL